MSVPSFLAMVSVVLGMIVTVTVEPLLAALESVEGALGAIVVVLSKVETTLVTLARAVIRMVQVEPIGAAVRVPVIRVRPPTTAVAVEQVPPPLGVAVTLITGVIMMGSVSV